MSVEIGIEVGITALIAGMTINPICLARHVDARNCVKVRVKLGLYTYCGNKGWSPEGEIGGG